MTKSKQPMLLLDKTAYLVQNLDTFVQKFFMIQLQTNGPLHFRNSRDYIIKLNYVLKNSLV